MNPRASPCRATPEGHTSITRAVTHNSYSTIFYIAINLPCSRRTSKSGLDEGLGRTHRMAAGLNAGTVWLNSYRSLSYASPFGGRGMSGHGKELGIEGLLEFTNTKSVSVETADEPLGEPFVLR